MDLQKLQRVVVDALEDVKAQDIKVFNTIGISDMFDRVILASGSSNRQTRALAWSVVGKVKEAGGAVVSVEGTDAGEWVLVDLGDVVVHIMQPAIRDYYGLEEMWGSKPLKVKLVSAQRGNKPRDEEPVSAAEPEAPAPAAKARKAAKKAAGKTKTAAKKAPARKVSAKKAPAKKAAKRAAKEAPSPSPRKSPASRAAAKKVAAKRTAKAAKAVKTAKAAKPARKRGA
jgi:ribosome-associated protein